MQLSEPPGPGSWLQWVQQLQGIAQTGLAFSTDPYDRERYAQLRQLAASVASRQSEVSFVRFDAVPLLRAL